MSKAIVRERICLKSMRFTLCTWTHEKKESDGPRPAATLQYGFIAGFA